MFTKKKRGATPATPAEIRAHQERRRRFCKSAQPAVLCDAELPSSWQPLSNNARYQMWMQRKGVAA